MNELVSVIIPAYNAEKFLSRCVESIINQTYRNIEIIIVNDGSRDNTADIAKECAKKDSRVKLINKENGGVTSARLRGVREASGEWIGFVDSDDEIESEMYERLLLNAEKYNAQISHCGYQMIFADGRVHYFHNTGNVVTLDNQAGVKALLDGSMIEPGLWNKLFHKTLLHSLFQKHSMPTDIKINEDLLMNYYLFSEADISVFDDFCPYHYILHDTSATRKALNEHDLRDPIKVKEIILKDVPDYLLNTAKAIYLQTCIGTCCRIVREKNLEYYNIFEETRKKITEHKSWYNLLNKKNRLFVFLIQHCPALFGIAYRFYFNKVSKKPYD